jgi:hypothetical protein
MLYYFVVAKLKGRKSSATIWRAGRTGSITHIELILFPPALVTNVPNKNNTTSFNGVMQCCSWSSRRQKSRSISGESLITNGLVYTFELCDVLILLSLQIIFSLFLFTFRHPIRLFYTDFHFDFFAFIHALWLVGFLNFPFLVVVGVSLSSSVCLSFGSKIRFHSADPSSWKQQ